MGLLAALGGYGLFKSGQNSRNNNTPTPISQGLALPQAPKATGGMPSLAGQSPMGMASAGGSPLGAVSSRAGQRSPLG